MFVFSRRLTKDTSMIHFKHRCTYFEIKHSADTTVRGGEERKKEKKGEGERGSERKQAL